MFKKHYEDSNEFCSERTSSSHDFDYIKTPRYDYDTKTPENQLSGTIFYLTLRKVFNSRWNQHIKFSFGLLRGLFLDWKRPPKTSRCRSRNAPTTPKNHDPSLVCTPKAINRSSSYTKFRSGSTVKTFKRVQRKIFHFKNPQIRETALKLMRKIKNVQERTLKNTFSCLISGLSKFKYLKICETFNRRKLKSLSEYFVNWHFRAQDITMLKRFMIEDDSEMMIMPLPFDIHDYIDDFYELSKDKIDATYFSFNSTRDVTSRLTTAAT
ncbi:hypothetical protein SteCoe_9591 [Stentor coeruleus]|uniref:Uncharacterized protein n=1 Tax=Stentor coeruleus TaxID=5963 RepID=A0A1R2CHF7_9CILI|nr:hypothetical protein SteCoe_9591 [Stentor coeruleus]